ncbi:beta-hexosaminidase [Striga asiatica]|uniref:Beta-hexosaminidase n=1 Tax=Striga asiatica TaxID=4170 RepID=A0A5A7R304_STRAF|nr:beta-hexosaminidase [Striga asiatica]
MEMGFRKCDSRLPSQSRAEEAKSTREMDTYESPEIIRRSTSSPSYTSLADPPSPSINDLVFPCEFVSLEDVINYNPRILFKAHVFSFRLLGLEGMRLLEQSVVGTLSCSNNADQFKNFKRMSKMMPERVLTILKKGENFKRFGQGDPSLNPTTRLNKSAAFWNYEYAKHIYPINLLSRVVGLRDGSPKDFASGQNLLKFTRIHPTLFQNAFVDPRSLGN